MATHCSILAWRISWTEEPGRLQSMGSQRVGHNWATNTYTAVNAQQIQSSQDPRQMQKLGMLKSLPGGRLYLGATHLQVQWLTPFVTAMGCIVSTQIQAYSAPQKVPLFRKGRARSKLSIGHIFLQCVLSVIILVWGEAEDGLARAIARYELGYLLSSVASSTLSGVEIRY